MRAGVAYPIRLELEHEKYDAIAQLLWETPGGRGDEVAEAVAAARAADAVVMVLGLSSRLEGEEMPLKIEGFSGGDRTSLDLPKVQQDLMEKVVAVAAGKPVVLVLLNGSALAVNWADQHVPAIVEAWYPGQAGGKAVADVLFGDVSPAGRLPVTFYESVAQLPPFADYAMEGRTYRYFRGEPLYPFGHGLSYTRFEYSGLTLFPARLGKADRLEVSLEVRNAGTRDGDEVVQLYVRDAAPKSTSPVRQLRGFARVALKAGERRTVRFTLVPGSDLGRYDEAGKAFAVDPGAFEIEVGASSRDLRLRSRVHVD
jgi:beta-glucosidase